EEVYPATIQLGTIKPTLESPPDYTAPARYTAKEEIHHVFNPDAKSPPKILTLVFLGAVLASLGGLVAAVSLLPFGFCGLLRIQMSFYYSLPSIAANADIVVQWL